MCNKKRLGLYFSEDLIDRIKRESEKLSISQNTFVVMAVNEYLKQAEGINALSQALAKLQQSNEAQ